LNGLRKYLLILGASGLATAMSPLVTNAQSCQSAEVIAGCSPNASIQAKFAGSDIQGIVFDLGPSGFKTSLGSLANSSGAPSPDPNFHRSSPSPPSGPTGIGPLPVFCRRDDHAFLPPQAQAGLPCGTVTTGSTVDPQQVARQMFDELALPSLRLEMNPRLGMVAVPTWFWVEGYDGSLIPLRDNLVLTHQECGNVADRDDNGAAKLDDGGAPITHRACKTITDTLSVEVHAWPRAYEWSFGDARSKTIRCVEIAACPQGIGLAYTGPSNPSPIAHAYQWSSLGVNGSADVYTVGLDITFGAQYRFSMNGASPSGWQTLDDRNLAWSADHRVQEAQAVLTRP
jgi:hypothetical protein